MLLRLVSLRASRASPKTGGTRSKKALDPKPRSCASSEEGEVPWRLPPLLLMQGFAPDQIREGAELFAVNCSPCHGPRMQGSESAFDLRKFPPEQRDRFLSSVTRGRNQMPPWGDAFSSEQLDALWAYVMAGER
jgi:mono/diheme cytochrome c family protein